LFGGRGPGCGTLLLAATLFGFAACPARREDRFLFSLFSRLSARLLRLLRSAGLLFGSRAGPASELQSYENS